MGRAKARREDDAKEAPRWRDYNRASFYARAHRACPLSDDSDSAPALDPRQVRRRFERAGAQHPKAAADRDPLASEVGRRMFERFEVVKLNPALVVDAGCGAGGALQGLLQRFPNARIIAVDFVLSVLRQAAAAAPGARLPEWMRRWVRSSAVAFAAADFGRLPLAERSVDCIWSNLALHWHNDVPAVLEEWHRVLREGGLVQFSTLGPDTLKELRGAARQAGSERVHRFIDMHDIGDMLVHAGFADPVMDMEPLTLTYRDLDGLFADLRASGATSALGRRARGLAPRGEFQQMRAAYEALRRDGVLPATFEVIYGHAWKPAPVPGRARDGVAVIRPEDIGRGRSR
jgi:malonyl-CoA O-methyltransferase